MSQPKVLKLDALDIQRSVEWQGKTYRVRGISLRIAKLIDAAQSAPAETRAERYLDVVAAVVPDMPREALEDLSLPHILTIIQLADPLYEPAGEGMTPINTDRVVKSARRRKGGT